MRDWRAWVLVAVSGIAVVAGAFLLPRGGTDPALAAAARRSLAVGRYRLTSRGEDGSSIVEDFQSPDRLRTVSRRGAVRFETVTIGRTSYGRTTCTTPSGTTSALTTHHLRAATTGTGTALLSGATAADATQVHPGVYAYTFRLAIPVKLQKQQRIDPVVYVEAHVAHGRIASFVLHHREHGHTLTGTETFDFGAVPDIVAPSGHRVEALQCSSDPDSPT